jgi:hypothetical protein
MILHSFRLLLLAALILGGACPPAQAQTPSGGATSAMTCAAGDTSSTCLLADGSNLRQLFSGIGGRARVVQFCVVTMCIALFIMMRKFN